MSIFNNPNRPQGNVFGNQPQTNTNNPIFGGATQQQQPANIFGTQQPQQQQGNIFGTQQPQQQQQGNIFGNQPQQQQQQQGNIFGTQQPQQQSNIFGNQAQQQQQQQQQQQRPGLFNQPNVTTPQQGTNIFGTGQQQQGTNIFGNQQQGTNMFPNQQQQMNTIPLSQASMFGTGSDSQRVRLQIEQFLRKVDPKNLQQIRIDDMNMYKDYRLNDLPQQTKNAIMTLVNNMNELRKIIDGIKKQNEQLDKKAADYCKNVQQKLVKYKQCLIQNIHQSNLLQEVKSEVDMIQKQVNGFIIPLYNAHITGRQMSFDSPDEFSSTIAKNILQKMIELNNKLDEIISCQQNLEGESLSERDSATLLVLEQLLNYYENVSAKVLEFTNRYNAIKREQILSHKRTSAYEEVVKRIKEKVDSKMKQDFKCYDLIKEIETIIEKRERFERELNEESRESFERRHDLMSSSSNRWNRI